MHCIVSAKFWVRVKVGILTILYQDSHTLICPTWINKNWNEKTFLFFAIQVKSMLFFWYFGAKMFYSFKRWHRRDICESRTGCFSRRDERNRDRRCTCTSGSRSSPCPMTQFGSTAAATPTTPPKKFRIYIINPHPYGTVQNFVSWFIFADFTTLFSS